MMTPVSEDYKQWLEQAPRLTHPPRSLVTKTTTASLNSTTRCGPCQFWSDGVAQLVQHRTRDPKTRGSNSICVRSTRTICENFSGSKCCADSLLVCPTSLLPAPPSSPPRVYTHAYQNDHARTLTILQSMLEFGGLWKHEKSQHAFNN